MAETMKAVVRDRYGTPDVLRVGDVARPDPRAGELRVRVLAASVNKGDAEILHGSPLWVRLAGFGLFNPRQRILGTNVAGRVEEKVLNFPTAKMEELVRRVTDREMKLIVRLGYVLGAFVGSILVVMNLIWG